MHRSLQTVQERDVLLKTHSKKTCTQKKKKSHTMEEKQRTYYVIIASCENSQFWRIEGSHRGWWDEKSYRAPSKHFFTDVGCTQNKSTVSSYRKYFANPNPYGKVRKKKSKRAKNESKICGATLITDGRVSGRSSQDVITSTKWARNGEKQPKPRSNTSNAATSQTWRTS